MSFPYSLNVNVPAANNNPADDQAPMQTNFANINGYLGVDHFLPGAANSGFHQQVHLLNRSDPGLGSSSGVFYAKSVSGVSWPFWQNANVYQLLGSITAATSGSVFLPGGIIIKWGQTAIPASSSATGTQSFSGGAFPTNTFVVLVSLQSKVGGTSASNNTIAVRSGSTTLIQFTWDFNGNSGSYTFFNWIAIGN